VQASQNLTVGTFDANGQTPNFAGSLRLGVQVGNPATTANEADVKAVLDLKDVRRKADLTDYSGEVQAVMMVRITDRHNGLNPSITTQAGTMYDIPFPITGTCASTASTSIGSECGVTTTFNSLVPPGAIKEGKRAIWELQQVQVNDGGSDGQVGTVPNSLFAVQGVFVP